MHGTVGENIVGHPVHSSPLQSIRYPYIYDVYHQHNRYNTNATCDGTRTASVARHCRANICPDNQWTDRENSEMDIRGKVN